MLRCNGARSVANCKDMQSVAAKRFFGVFYRWSRGGCLGQRQNIARTLHTDTGRKEFRPSVSLPYSKSNPSSQIRHRYQATTPSLRRHELTAPEPTLPEKSPKIKFTPKRESIRKLRKLQQAATNPPEIRYTEDEEGKEDEMRQAKDEELIAAKRLEIEQRPEASDESAPRESMVTENEAKTSESESGVTEEEIKDLTREKPEQPKISQNLRKIMRALPASVVVVTTSLTVTATPEPTRFAYADPDGTLQRQPSGLELNARGMTLSSFTTLTLTPYPIIQFNIKAPSRTLDALMETRHFLVHILEATKAGAKVAAAFTKGNATGPNAAGSPFVDPEAFKVKPTKVEFRKWITEKDGTYIRPNYWKLKAEEERIQWVPNSSGTIRRPPRFVPVNAARGKEVPFDGFPIADKIRAIEEERGASVMLPRLVSDGVLRTLHCKVLDKGQRGGRGDGFVKVGDHVMVLAQVHNIIGSTPVEEISHKNQKALAYAHGNFTATRPIINPYTEEKETQSEDNAFLKEQREEVRKLVSGRSYGEVDEAQSPPKTENYSSGEEAEPDNDLSEALIANGKKVPKEETIQQGDGPVIRKIASKGMSLREINELANYYAFKAIEIRKDLPFTDYNIPENPALKRISAQEQEDVEERLSHKGPRIIKHVSTRGSSLDDIREEHQIAEKLEIPRRIAQEAIEELPDADAQARREYALLKAAEELAARKEQIARLRSSRGSFAHDGADIGKRQKHVQDLKEKEPKIHKYRMNAAPLDPELQPKIDQVWDKIARFKRLEQDLCQADDERDGLFWRPQEIVKIQKDLKAGKQFEKTEEVDAAPEKQNLSEDELYKRWQERELAWKDQDADDELRKWEESELAVKKLDPVRTKNKKGKELSNRAKKKLAKEEKARERGAKYRESDPWAEEFS
ncbi:hypothetical protein BDZ45DRAFT_97368 [Acephala macrosclerotiorum]|nr:hypothetical protein BDZ45DRAFT_97368 [Acephala macrosclerotiorum]